MSRCFPFPPPGYVNKTRTDDVHSLKKEKEREKKHRKDRGNKERRESKERKEKDRSEGKHGDKKENEKHRDKKKDRDKEKEKNRDQEKDRGSTSEERGHSEQQTDGRNIREKIVDKGRPPEQIPGTFSNMEKEKNRPHVSNAKRVGGQSASHSTAPKGIEKNQNIHKNQNNHAVHKPVDAKFVAELGKRVRDEGGVTSQSSEKVTVNGQKKDASMVRLLNASSGPLANRKEIIQERRGDHHRLNGQGVKDKRDAGGTVTSQNLSIIVQMFEGMPRPPKTSVEEKMAGTEKIREKEGQHLGLDKHTVLDLQKIKTPGKDKGLDREKKKDERAKKVVNRVHEEEKLRERVDSLDAADASNIFVHVLEKVSKIVPSSVNYKKRKNLEPNGFLHENETRQIKLPRPLSALSHPPSVENEKVLDAPQSTNQRLPLIRQGQLDMVKVDKPKGHKPNSILDKNPGLVSSLLDAASLELLVKKSITRSIHPDLKYLGEVLTVPKFEGIVPPEEDDEWLFGSRLELQKQMGSHSSDEIKETLPWVWSDSVPLDSLDMVALPYVIPF